MSARVRPYAAFFFDKPAQDKREWLAAQCAAIGIVDPKDGNVLAGSWGDTWVYAEAHDLTECRVLAIELASYNEFLERLDQTRGDALEEDGLYELFLAFRDTCETLRPKFAFFKRIPLLEIQDEVAALEEAVTCYYLDELVNGPFALVYLSQEYDEALFLDDIWGERDEMSCETGRLIFASRGKDRTLRQFPDMPKEQAEASEPVSSDQSSPTPGDPQAPPVTPEVWALAREHPGQRLDIIDPMYRGRDQVPPYAIIGVWEVDERGELVRYEPNPDYRPSPRARNWPEPTDPVDEAVQLIASGHAPDEVLTEALAGATVTVAVTGNDAIRVAEDEHGPYVAVFTAPRHLPGGDHRWRQWAVRDLVGVLPPGCALAVNLNSPASPVNVRVPVAEIAAFLQAGQNQW
ncbi:hypothetical protein LI90_873 [Carbonactinospora thermoautotrophica]|uniref:SseB protein N-terminal domain-containing protein n=1 Tax=Carbonactinospora thermoautotrophica TaxID=1469144 RepID=A0A132MNE3_9ACTN|nr:type VII secretion system-associated protein [Carbonactinospora thermoautotrophica]KWW99239.1 hypothetical protein LI90_873 [Carbonactinospora thermoautotrophica]